MALVATYVPYSELNNGKPSTFDEFCGELGVFARTRILHICSAMNAALFSNEDALNQEAHDAFVRTFFEPPLAERLLRKQGDVRFVFHRQQVLFVAKTAVLACSDDGLIPGPLQFRRLGRIFLMAGDHLPNPVGAPEQLDNKFAYLAAQFLPIQEASGFHRFDHKVARSFMMLSQCAPKLHGDPCYYDIQQTFEKITGVPLVTFQSLLFGSLARFHKFHPKAYVSNPKNFGLSKTWFASTAIAPDVVDRFLELVSATPAEFKCAYERSNQGTSDFTPFRDRPLFRDGDFLFLIDFAFLAEKFETAPFWTVHNYLREKRARDALHAFWGRVFEKYGCEILQGSSSQPMNVVHESPSFVDKQKGEVCDAIVICGNTAALIELKGTTFSSFAKYGGDFNSLKAELDYKLFQDREGNAKAVLQLKRAVDLICGSDTPEQVDGVDLKYIKTVYPVIVTRDDVGSTVGVNAFLQVRFDGVVRRKQMRKTVTPVFCLDAEDLERLTAYLTDTPFTDLLGAHWKASRTQGRYLSNPYFATNNNAMVQRKGVRRPKTIERFWDDLSEKAAEHLGLKL